MSLTLNPPTRPAAAAVPVRATRGAAVFVWGMWAFMLVAAVALVAKYGANVPFCEDWILVPALTGDQPVTAAWLWEQNNEHRVPLGRLLFLVLLKLTGGDFRAGMFFNVLIVGALAFAMIQVATRLRGQTHYADAFFPLALLHWGHWQNFAWSWQLAQVIVPVVAGTLLLVIVQQGAEMTSKGALLAGTCLILLPVCGAAGLAYVPAMAVWLVYCAVVSGRSADPTVKRNGRILLAVAAATCLLVGLYYVGYQRAYWNPPSPGLAATLKTSALFLSFGLGPATFFFWPIGHLIVPLLSLASAIVLFRVWRDQPEERGRALGLLLFLGANVCLALGVGWGRAGLIPTDGFPTRYAVMAVPTLCCIYFIWETYSPPFSRGFVPMCLFTLLCILFGPNLQRGFEWSSYYRPGMEAFERDLRAGVPPQELAAHHRQFLLHWDQKKLAAGMQMLHRERIGLFRLLRTDSGR